MAKNKTQAQLEFIKLTLDKEPKISFLITSFAKSFKEEFKGKLSDNEMKGLYNMILFLACSIVDVKNKEKENEQPIH